MKQREAEDTIWESFCDFLNVRGHGVERPARDKSQRPIHPCDEKTQDVLLHVVRNEPDIALLAECLVDFDEGLQEWRYRHVKMVERTIGAKGGTGGSAGVAYLRSTLHVPIFPDLWAIRNKL